MIRPLAFVLLGMMASRLCAGLSVEVAEGFSSAMVRLRTGESLELNRASGKATVYRCQFRTLTVSRYTDRPEWLEAGQVAEPEPCLRCDQRMVWTAGKLRIATNEPGTYFFRVGEAVGDYCSEEPPDPASDVWLKVVIRKGDDYLGLLTELFQTPFLITPKATDFGNQSDLGWGADCAAFAIYGRRRMGEKVGYGGPRGILHSLVPLTPWLHLRTGKYFDPVGKAIDLAKVGLMPGDVLHSGEQVSVYFQDQGIAGFLDPDDLVIQAQPGGPAIVALRDNGYFPNPIRAYRWLAH